MTSKITRRLLVLTLAFAAIAPFATLATFAEETPRRDLLDVKFKEINAKGYPIFVLTNKTGRNIETIRGGFIAETLTGDIVAATGQTNAVPGQVFLAAGKSMDIPPYGFNRKEGLMKTLRTNPDSLRFFFEVRDITYLDTATAADLR